MLPALLRNQHPAAGEEHVRGMDRLVEPGAAGRRELGHRPRRQPASTGSRQRQPPPSGGVTLYAMQLGPMDRRQTFVDGP
jgi:hypothetical protein